MMEQMLIDGVDINSRDRHGMTALHYNYKSDSVLDWLLEKGADINAPGIKGQSCLHLAAREYGGKQLDICDKLLDMHADPNAKDDNGTTPLLIHCEMHNKSVAGVRGSRISCVRHLLNSHADPGIADTTGNALHHALWGAIPDAAAEPERPGILVALLETDRECINVGNPGQMIEHRAGSDNNTPLQRACHMDRDVHDSYGKPDPNHIKSIIEFLIYHKADYRGPDGNGVPPRRLVTSGVLRNLFNDASKISQPGAPAVYGKKNGKYSPGRNKQDQQGQLDEPQYGAWRMQQMPPPGLVEAVHREYPAEDYSRGGRGGHRPQQRSTTPSRPHPMAEHVKQHVEENQNLFDHPEHEGPQMDADAEIAALKAQVKALQADKEQMARMQGKGGTKEGGKAVSMR